MVCFIRIDLLEHHLDSNETIDAPRTADQQCIDVPFPIEKFPYKLLFSKPFPFNEDARGVEEKIMDDVKYFINRHLTADDQYFDEERDIWIFPLENMLPFVHDATDLKELRAIVQKEFMLNEHDCIEHKLIESSDFDESDYDDDNRDSDGDAQHGALNQLNCGQDDESWD